MHKWVILERFPLLETAISNSHRSAADDYACKPKDVHRHIYVFFYIFHFNFYLG